MVGGSEKKVGGGVVVVATKKHEHPLVSIGTGTGSRDLCRDRKFGKPVTTADEKIAGGPQPLLCSQIPPDAITALDP